MTPTPPFDELRRSLVTRYQQLHHDPPNDAAYNAAVKALALLQNETLRSAGELAHALRSVMDAGLFCKRDSLKEHRPEWHEYWSILLGYLEYLLYELEEYQEKTLT